MCLSIGDARAGVPTTPHVAFSITVTLHFTVAHLSLPGTRHPRRTTIFGGCWLSRYETDHGNILQAFGVHYTAYLSRSKSPFSKVSAIYFVVTDLISKVSLLPSSHARIHSSSCHLLLRSHSSFHFWCVAVSEITCLSYLRRLRTFTLAAWRDDVSPACLPFHGS